jgi:sulfur carrier protein
MPDKLTGNITIRTDDGHKALPAGSSLADAVDLILATQSKAAEQVATAVNGQFVPRGARTAHILQDGDTVLCFSPITGG